MKSSVPVCRCEQCGNALDLRFLQSEGGVVDLLKCAKCLSESISIKNHPKGFDSNDYLFWRLRKNVDHKPLSEVMQKITHFLMQPSVRNGEHCVDTFKLINCLMLIAYADMEKVLRSLEDQKPFGEENAEICDFISKMSQYLLHLESHSLKTSEKLRRLMLKYNKII